VREHEVEFAPGVAALAVAVQEQHDWPLLLLREAAR
jgi:hypothetical protein